MAWYDIQSDPPDVWLYWGGVRRGLVKSSNGDLFAGYTQATDGYGTERAFIEKSTNEGTSWDFREDVSGADGFDFIAMCIDSNDNIFVLYEDGTNIKTRKRSSGGVWSFPIIVASDGEGIAIVVDSNDDLYVIIDYMSASVDYLRLYKSTNNGSSWFLKSTPLSDESGYAMDIAIDSNDGVHIVLNDHYRKSTNGGTSWGISEDTGSEVGDGLSIVIDNSNIPHLLKDYGNGNIIRYVSRISGSWANEIILATFAISGGWEIFCTLCRDQRGILYAMWCGGLYQENISMRYSCNRGYSWSPEIQLYEGIKTNREQVWYPYSMSSIWPKISGISFNIMASGWNCVMYDDNWEADWSKIKYSSGIIAIEEDFAFVA